MSLSPTDVETICRNKYNASNDTFFGTAEILSYMTQACTELARNTYCIERTYTTTSTSGTQDYSYPTNTISIKRVTYNGHKLYPINLREDDALTLSNTLTTQTGNPQYYTVFNNTMSLRPIPDTSALTIKVYSFNLPTILTSTSSLEIPLVFQYDIVDYICQQMAAKDQNYSAAQYFGALWTEHMARAKIYMRKMKRGDSFATIQDENTLPTTIIGAL